MPVTPRTRASLSTRDVRLLGMLADLDLAADLIAEPRRLHTRYVELERRERSAPAAVTTSIEEQARTIADGPGETTADVVDQALAALADERSRAAILEQTVELFATACSYTVSKYRATMRGLGDALLAALDSAAQAAAVDLAQAVGKHDPDATDRATLLETRRAPRDARAFTVQALARLEALDEAARELRRSGFITLGPLNLRNVHPDDLSEFLWDDPIKGREVRGYDVDQADHILAAGPRYLNTAQWKARDTDLDAAHAAHEQAVERAERIVDRYLKRKGGSDADVDAALTVLAEHPTAAKAVADRRHADLQEAAQADWHNAEGSDATLTRSAASTGSHTL